ncbi:hypothetical protein WDW89_09595 [Deltaproteobacteria bacterium TL4]
MVRLLILLGIFVVSFSVIFVPGYILFSPPETLVQTGESASIGDSSNRDIPAAPGVEPGVESVMKPPSLDSAPKEKN